MPFVDWFIRGTQISNCNCAWGCPCQFNALPTHGHCRALVFMQIDEGRFGDTKLDGLSWGLFVAWPGPIHFGNGEEQIVIDERADAKQREAIEAIALGRETEPGTLITQVFSAVIAKHLPTLFKPINLSINLEERTASVRIPDMLEGRAEPIRNPVTGEPHYARVVLPKGFEYTEAEFASGTAHAKGAIELKFEGTHAHLARVNWSTHGVVQ